MSKRFGMITALLFTFIAAGLGAGSNYVPGSSGASTEIEGRVLTGSFEDGSLILSITDGLFASGSIFRATLEDIDGVVVSEGAYRIRGTDDELVLPLNEPLPRSSRFYRIKYSGTTSGGKSAAGTISLSRIFPSLRVKVVGERTWTPESSASIRVIVLDGRTNQPVEGAKVTIGFTSTNGENLGDGKTNAAGTWDGVFDVPRLASGAAELLVTIEGDGISESITEQITIESSHMIHLSTDKPLYQPGQLINIRALAMTRGLRAASNGETSAIEVLDADGNIVFRKRGETNDFGIFSAEFQLADRINLGDWRIRAIVGNSTEERTVRVEKYVLPKFRVTLTTDREFYHPGDVIEGEVESAYFFGKIVAGRAKVSLDIFDVGFNTIGIAEGRLDESGKFKFKLELPERLVGQPLLKGDALAKLTAEITDAADQVVSVTKTKNVTRDRLKIAFVPESGDPVAGIENNFYVLVAYPDGRPVPNATIELIEKLAPGAGKANEKFSGRADENGVWVFASEYQEGASYLVAAADRQGYSAELTYTPDASAISSILLRPSKAVAEVGEKLTLTAFGRSASRYAYFDIVKNGQTVVTKSAALKDGRAELALTLTPELEGTLVASAYTINERGEMIRDERILFVRGSEELGVKITQNREVHRPGEEITLNFAVTNGEGKPTAAALGVAIVDEAVYALAEAEPGLARVFFAIERELLEPRWEIHGLGHDELFSSKPGAPNPRAEVLLSATAKIAAPTIERDSLDESLANDIDGLDAALRKNVEPIGTALYAALEKSLADRIWEMLGEADYDDAKVREILVKDAGITRDSLLDPWGVPLLFALRNSELEVKSAGPDGIWENADDLSISTWIGERHTQRRWALMGRGMPVPEAIGFDMDGANFDMAMAPRAMASAAEGGAGGWIEERMFLKSESISRTDGAAGDASDASPIRIREYFPETLLWVPSLVTNEDGTTSLTFRLADSITDWRAAVTASTRNGLIGGSTSSIRVFQDFFVDLNLPVAFTQGDRVSVPVAVYNYLDRAQTVELTLEKSDWFECEDGAPKRKVTLKAGEVLGVKFPIRVTGIGKHSFTLTARGEAMSDAVRREVTVEPDGRRINVALNGRLSGSTTLKTDIPARSLKGASSLVLKLYPGVFSQIVEGLEGMFRMPSGCFEQTTSTTYPNVILLNYLRQTGKSIPETELKASNYISIGYQRLVSFEVEGGGFEWFGNAPANQLLTAYGLQEFADMAKVHEIDPKLIPRTARWLAAKQENDGSWKPDPHWFELIPDGIASSGLMSTAFITWSLAEASQEPDAVNRGLAYLKKHAKEIDDAYTLGIVANAQAAAKAPDRETFDRLAAMAIVGKDTAYWGTDKPTAVYGTGEAATLEATALAALALVRSQMHPMLAEKALNYLVSQKGSFGTWNSTQATVLALKALTIASTTSWMGASDATIAVKINGEKAGTVTIEKADADILRQIDLTNYLRSGENDVEISVSGKANMIYQLATEYYTPWEGGRDGAGAAYASPLLFDVKYDRTTLAVDDTLKVTATATYTAVAPGPMPRPMPRPEEIVKDRAAGKKIMPWPTPKPGPAPLSAAKMVILDIGVPPGFTVEHDALAKAVEEKRVQSYDITGRQVILYIEELKSGEPFEITFGMKATMPVEAKSPRSRAYLYYDSQIEKTVEPEKVTVDQDKVKPLANLVTSDC